MGVPLGGALSAPLQVDCFQDICSPPNDKIKLYVNKLPYSVRSGLTSIRIVAHRKALPGEYKGAALLVVNDNLRRGFHDEFKSGVGWE